MKLLEDTFIIENLQILNEGGKSGPMKIRGCFQRADEANNNKRIYKKPLLEREINKLAESITERRLMGELDHPQNDSVRLSNVSHLITGLNMKGNEVIGEAEILDTPSGKVAKALIEGGVKVGISSRGMGTVTEEMDGKRYVNEDFKLITWDLVADPSTRGAFPGLTESTQIQDIIDTVYPEAQKVKNFTTLLKEELLTEIVASRKDLPDPGRKKGPAKYVPPKVDPTRKAPPPSLDPHKRYVQNSSTQLVNFMRDKLMETKQTGQKRPPQKHDYSHWSGYAPSDKRSRKYTPKNDSTQFVNFMRDKLIEWKAGPTAKRLAGQAGDEEGRMSSTGKKIKDALVRREAAKTQANVDRKLGVKTNLRTKDAIQGSMNRRRAAAKAGKSVPGSPPLPRETKKDAAADAAQDKKRREAPGDR